MHQADHVAYKSASHAFTAPSSQFAPARQKPFVNSSENVSEHKVENNCKSNFVEPRHYEHCKKEKSQPERTKKKTENENNTEEVVRKSLQAFHDNLESANMSTQTECSVRRHFYASFLNDMMQKTADFHSVGIFVEYMLRELQLRFEHYNCDDEFENIDSNDNMSSVSRKGTSYESSCSESHTLKHERHQKIILAAAATWGLYLIALRTNNMALLEIANALCNVIYVQDSSSKTINNNFPNATMSAIDAEKESLPEMHTSHISPLLWQRLNKDEELVQCNPYLQQMMYVESNTTCTTSSHELVALLDAALRANEHRRSFIIRTMEHARARQVRMCFIEWRSLTRRLRIFRMTTQNKARRFHNINAQLRLEAVFHLWRRSVESSRNEFLTERLQDAEVQLESVKHQFQLQCYRADRLIESVRSVRAELDDAHATNNTLREEIHSLRKELDERAKEYNEKLSSGVRDAFNITRHYRQLLTIALQSNLPAEELVEKLCNNTTSTSQMISPSNNESNNNNKNSVKNKNITSKDDEETHNAEDKDDKVDKIVHKLIKSKHLQEYTNIDSDDDDDDDSNTMTEEKTANARVHHEGAQLLLNWVNHTIQTESKTTSLPSSVLIPATNFGRDWMDGQRFLVLLQIYFPQSVLAATPTLAAAAGTKLSLNTCLRMVHTVTLQHLQCVLCPNDLTSGKEDVILRAVSELYNYAMQKEMHACVETSTHLLTSYLLKDSKYKKVQLDDIADEEEKIEVDVEDSVDGTTNNTNNCEDKTIDKEQCDDVKDEESFNKYISDSTYFLKDAQNKMICTAYYQNQLLKYHDVIATETQYVAQQRYMHAPLVCIPTSRDNISVNDQPSKNVKSKSTNTAKSKNKSAMSNSSACEPFCRINLPSNVLEELKFDGKVGGSSISGQTKNKTPTNTNNNMPMMTTSRKMANLQLSVIARRYVETTSRIFYYYASPSANADNDTCAFYSSGDGGGGHVGGGASQKNVVSPGKQSNIILPTMTEFAFWRWIEQWRSCETTTQKSALANISYNESNTDINTASSFATIIRSAITPPPLPSQVTANSHTGKKKKGKSNNNITCDIHDNQESHTANSTHGKCVLSNVTLADIFDKVASPNLSAALRAAAAHGKGTTDVQTLKHVAQQEIELREIDPYQFMELLIRIAHETFGGYMQLLAAVDCFLSALPLPTPLVIRYAPLPILIQFYNAPCQHVIQEFCDDLTRIYFFYLRRQENCKDVQLRALATRDGGRFAARLSLNFFLTMLADCHYLADVDADNNYFNTDKDDENDNDNNSTNMMSNSSLTHAEPHNDDNATTHDQKGNKRFNKSDSESSYVNTRRMRNLRSVDLADVSSSSTTGRHSQLPPLSNSSSAVGVAATSSTSSTAIPSLASCSNSLLSSERLLYSNKNRYFISCAEVEALVKELLRYYKPSRSTVGADGYNRGSNSGSSIVNSEQSEMQVSNALSFTVFLESMILISQYWCISPLYPASRKLAGFLIHLMTRLTEKHIRSTLILRPAPPPIPLRGSAWVDFASSTGASEEMKSVAE